MIGYGSLRLSQGKRRLHSSGNSRLMRQGRYRRLEALELGEIRVRDALLRASSAQELFGSTLATSRDAYDKATRLTEEYNRQLETAEAKIQIAKNNLHDLSIELGNKKSTRLNSSHSQISNAVFYLK